MIAIKRITTNQMALYDFVEQLLTSAFPENEHRELITQREFTDHNPLFHVHVIFDDSTPIGFISYWDFTDFYYVEHFAIAAEQRNHKYGERVLEQLKENLGRPIVLEVEAPTDSLSERRINFYQRLGFTLWQNEYLQPPYRKGDESLPMFIMAHGNLIPEKDFQQIKETLYKEVYLV
ncbi:MAG: GNAT family N-acetyltransferase [Bacteroidaceae bacterium]